jgi:hypothetical protein
MGRNHSEDLGVEESNTGIHFRETKWEGVVKVKVKAKFSLCFTKHHAVKTYWGSGGIVPRILDLGSWEGVDWIYLSQDREQRRVLGNNVLNLRVR